MIVRGLDLGGEGLSDRLQVQEVADLDAVVQVGPVEGEAAGFEGPVGPLFRGGLGEPMQPRNLGERHSDFTAIIETNSQYARREVRAPGADLPPALIG